MNKNIQSLISQTNSIGFSIYSYLLILSDSKNKARTSISDIQNNCNIKDHRTIHKYLTILELNNLISINPDISPSTKYSLTEINLSPTSIILPLKDFPQFSSPMTWAVYCLLKENPNISIESLKIILNTTEQTLNNTLEELNEHNLVSNIK